MSDQARSSLWHIANEIEGMKGRFEGAADVLEIMAVSETGEPNSGALWFVRDAIKVQCELLDIEIDKLMEVQRQLREPEPEPEPKKKKK